jgi:exonuclease III
LTHPCGIDGESNTGTTSQNAGATTRDDGTATGTPDGKIDIKTIAFNCEGLKGSNDLISQLLDEDLCDVLFLSEHWIRPHEIPAVCNRYTEKGFLTHLKSGMPTEEEPTSGRPYEGVGFICRKKSDVTFKPIQMESRRLTALQVLVKGIPTMTIVGAYLPHFTGTTEQIALYSEVIDEIQGLMDTSAIPVLVAGDLNVNLPSHATLPMQ